MRRLILLFLGLSLLYGHTSAFNFQYNSSKKTNSCVVTVNRTYYIEDQTYSKTLYDEFWHTGGDKYISDGRTTISLWTQDNALVSSCNNASAWIRKSDVAPKNVRVVATAARCTFNKPTDKTKRNLQFVYNIGYSSITTGGSSSATKKYITTPNFLENPNNFSSKIYPNYMSVPEAIHGDECFNVELQYCGDGIRSTGNGETCDPADTSRAGWGNGGCNTSCQPIVNPTAVCTGLTANPSTGTGTLTSALACSGTNVSTYKIEVRNASGNLVSTLNSATGNVTLNTVGIYTAKCFVDGQNITPNVCQKTLEVKAIPVLDYDLALRKTLSSSTPGPFRIGDRVTFDITIFNQGDITASNIEITDYIPTGLTLADSNWTQSGNKATRVLNTLAAGANVTRSISFTINSSATASISNYAEISQDNGNDCDSTPDQNNGNDGTVVNNAIGTGCEPGGDEDDHDIETITIIPTAVCTGLTANPSTGTGTLTSALACSGTNVSTYKIEVKNSSGSIVFTSTDNQDTVTLNTIGNYTARCFVDGQTTTPNVCQKTLVVAPETIRPSIIIDKIDSNPIYDLDGVPYNDQQTVDIGNPAVFKIRVTNDGPESLNTIAIADSLAPNCAGSVTLPSSYPSTWNGFRAGGTGNKTDSVLEPGEWFEYTCQKSNTQIAYINEASVTAQGVTSRLPTSYTDVSRVFIPENPSSCNILTAIPSTGTGTLTSTLTCSGTNVSTYKIEVRNASGTLVNTLNSASGNVTLNTAGSYTASCYVDNKVVTPNSCIQTLRVNPINPNSYDLALRKTLSTSTPGPFNRGDTVTFNVEVFNQGGVSASNIQITDYIPGGLTLSDSNWTQSGNKATRVISSLSSGQSVVLPITFRIASDAPRTIKNVAEISSDDGNDCDSTPDQDNTNDGTVTDNAIGTGCEAGGDEDDHDIETIIVENGSDTYDLALRKTLSSTPPFSTGGLVTFNVTVFNQGTVGAVNAIVTDYIPAGLTLSDANWTQSGNKATRVISSLTAGQSVVLPITFRIASDATGSITNVAEISSDDGNDCDSTPDQNDGNQTGETLATGMVDNAIGTGCEPGGDEDDHDFEMITIQGPVTPACESLSASPASAHNSNLVSNLSCTGTGTIYSYLIEVKDSSGSVIFTSNNAIGTVSIPSGDTNYTASCYINGQTTTPSSCQQTLSVTTGGGGDTYKCSDILQTGSQVTCVGNSKVKSFKLYCGTGVARTIDYRNATKNGTTGRMEAVFNCSETVAECHVLDRKNITDDFGPAWRTENKCKTNLTPTCGDGVLDPGEKCDMGSDNGKPGFLCTATCKIPSNPPSCPPSHPFYPTCISTDPDDGDLIFGPMGTVIVGHSQNPLDQVGSPYLYNDSNYDFAFDKFCIKRMDSDNVGVELALKSGVNNGEYCADIGNDIVYAYERIELSQYGVFPNYTGNKSGIPASSDYGTAELRTSIKADIDNNGTIEELYNSYLHAKLDVRVAKPAVVTLGGGTSYVKDTTSGDVETVTSGVTGYSDNKNFVGTSASNSGISSYAESLNTTSNAGAVSDIGTDKTKYEASVNAVTDTTTATTVTVNSFSQKYNGLDNVYIVTGKNVELSSMPSLVTGATTFIIEGGNLKITGDMTSTHNVAFVVKGGNITIHKDVEKIDGTYIAIPVSGNGGEILGNGNTNKQLVVNGSLYGDITELIDDRYYISNDGGMLSVGTIVSFGSKLFSKPAPLVTQFIGEYLQAQKIAR